MRFDISDIIKIVTNINLVNNKLLSLSLIYHGKDFAQKKRFLKILLNNTDNFSESVYCISWHIIELIQRRKSDIDTLQIMILFGFDVNSLNHNGYLPLVEAVYRSKTDIDLVKLLIDNRADINKQDQYLNDIALIAACENCNTDCSIECVKLLINSNADLNLQGYNGETALINAATNANSTSSIECVKLLIESNANLELEDNDGETALHQACLHSNSSSSIECVNLLIESGAKFNDPSLLLKCFLYASIHNLSSVKCFKIVMHAIDVNWVDDDGNTTLINMCSDDEFDHHIVYKYANILIKNGADVNVQNQNGISALMYCVKNSNVQCAKLLIESNANLDLQDENGYTAVMLACINNRYDIVKLLIDAGADITLREKRHNVTALAFSCLRGNCKITKLLLDADVPVEMSDLTSIYNQCRSDEVFKCIKIVTKSYIPKINMADDYGATLLMHISNSNNMYAPNYIKLLVKYGADINIQDLDGDTALFYTASDDELIVNNIQCLIDLGADLNICDSIGFTFLMYMILVENYWTRENCSLLVKTIIRSDVTLVDSNGLSAYEHYLQSGYSILDKYELKLLKGEICLNCTKSARK